MASGDRIQIADQTTSDLISNKVDCIEGYIGNAISDVVPAETSGKINIANQETSDEIVEKLNNLTKLEDKRNTTVLGAYRTEEANDIGVEPHAEGGNYLTVYTRPRESGYMTSDTLIKTWIPGLTADKVQAGVTFGSSLTLTGTYTGDATATAAQILSAKTAYANGEKITGTMPNLTTNSTITHTSSNNTKVIVGDSGFLSTNSDGTDRYQIRYNGSNGYLQGNTLFALPYSTVAANIGLSADKIATGKTIIGVTGTYKGLGNATAAQVLSGKTFSTASLSNATGTMTDNSAKTSTSSYVTGTFKSGTTGYVFATPTAGYCSASTYIRVPVANLSAANIKKGVSIGGVAGTYAGSTYTLKYTPSSTSNFLQYLKIYDGSGTSYNTLYYSSISGSQYTTSLTATSKIIYITGGSRGGSSGYTYYLNLTSTAGVSVIKGTTSTRGVELQYTDSAYDVILLITANSGSTITLSVDSVK